MYLYTGSTEQFVEDAVQNRIAEKLKVSFFQQLHYNPSPSEVNSWRNSLRALCNALTHAQLLDVGVVLEWQLPLTSMRLDCLLTGKAEDSSAHAVIVELKQWDEAGPSSVEDCVVTYLGGRLRDVLHPSRQVGNYQDYLQDSHTAFSDETVRLSSCSYLPNLQHDPEIELFDVKHAALLERFPLFAGDQTSELANYLKQRLEAGAGQEVLATVLASKYKASKKLLDYVTKVIKREKSFILLDVQQVVFNAVMAKARESFHAKDKVVLLVKGGPGTGKSVVALNLIAELSAAGYNARHATGSRAFTQNLRKVVGSRAGVQFTYFNGYVNADYNIVDVLVSDEAHRIRPHSRGRFTKRVNHSDKRQIDELIHAAKVSVFFIDDLQVVRPGEVGNSDLIRKASEENGAKLFEFDLEAQFRCNGSEEFVNWIDGTLHIRRTANVLWERGESFDFQIFDSPASLAAAIRSKNSDGQTARLTAGFCWPWSDPTESGELVADVVIGDFAMPWNAKPDSTRLARGIPKSNFWASDPNGISQVGCIYTAQGFEFDYVGILFGRDLVYDPKAGAWVGQKQFSQDSVVKRSKSDSFLQLIKNTYRVLLTRGMKGCYVYFQDEATANFFRSRMT